MQFVYWRQVSTHRGAIGTIGFHLTSQGGKVEQVSEAHDEFGVCHTLYRIPYTEKRDRKAIVNRLKFLGYEGWTGRIRSTRSLVSDRHSTEEYVSMFEGV